MNKLLLVLPIVLVLLGTGCANPDTASVSTKQDSVNQIFEQKKQCEPYYAAYKKEKEDSLRSPSGTVTVSGCFSKKYSSCVGASAVSDVGSVGDGTAWIRWELKDILTGEVLSYDRDQIFGDGKDDDDVWHVKQMFIFSKDVIGVDCSDGQQLYPIR